MFICSRCDQPLPKGGLTPWCLGARYRCDPTRAVRVTPPAPGCRTFAPTASFVRTYMIPRTTSPQVAPGAAAPHLARTRDELRAHCRVLRLSTKGSPDDLRTRLRTHLEAAR